MKKCIGFEEPLLLLSGK